MNKYELRNGTLALVEGDPIPKTLADAIRGEIELWEFVLAQAKLRVRCDVSAEGLGGLCDYCMIPHPDPSIDSFLACDHCPVRCITGEESCGATPLASALDMLCMPEISALDWWGIKSDLKAHIEFLKGFEVHEEAFTSPKNHCHYNVVTFRGIWGYTAMMVPVPTEDSYFEEYSGVYTPLEYLTQKEAMEALYEQAQNIE